MWDPQPRAGSAELRAAIKSLTAFLEDREADLRLRKRARKEADRGNFRLRVEVIACNLTAVPLHDSVLVATAEAEGAEVSVVGGFETYCRLPEGRLWIICDRDYAACS
jgi:hypothetical protein